MTPERKVKDRVTKILKTYGAYYFYPVASMYGAAGIPDIVVCYRGIFIGIECKAGKGKVTALQQHNLDRIKESGGHSLVVRDDDTTELLALLDSLK